MTPPMAAAVALGASAWVAVLIAAPIMPVPAAGLLYAIGSLVCHQLPERSFHLDLYQLPVCARCVGLYAGGAIGSVVAAAAARTSPHQAVTDRETPRPRNVALAATLIAALPTAVTFVLEWGAEWPVSNAARAGAGVPLGVAVAFVVVRALATVHYGGCALRRPIDPGRPPSTRI